MNQFLRVLKLLRLRIYVFHRGKGFLCVPASWPQKFVNTRPTVRWTLLTIASLFIGFRLFRFCYQVAAEIGSFLATSNQAVKVWCLMYFDFLVLMGIASGLLLIILLFSGRPETTPNSFPIPFLRGRPVPTFFLSAAFAAALLFSTPTWIADLFLHFDVRMLTAPRPSILPVTYIRQALLLSFCFGFSMADTASDAKAFRWWLLPFVFIPFGALGACPLMWWNAAAGFLPSRFWKLWKPVLAAITCTMPLVYYPLSMPMRTQIPLYHPSSYITPNPICNDRAYQVAGVPGSPEAYLRCGGGTLIHALRIPEGGWKNSGELDLGFYWNQAGFDFELRRAFVYDGMNNRIRSVDLTTMSLESETQLAPEVFPNPHDDCSVAAYSQKYKRLYIAGINGVLGIFDVRKHEMIRKTQLSDGDFSVIVIDEDQDEFFVLKGSSISLFNLSDSTLKHNYSDLGPTTPRGMVLDRERGRIWLSFPESLSVKSFDRKDMKPLGEWPAPIGVRVLSIDPKRNLLFMGSVSGVLELRDLDDMHRISRTRLIPWIHWIEVFSDSSSLILTGGDLPPLVWPYDPPDRNFDFFDKAFELFDALVYRLIHRVSAGLPKPTEGLT